MRDSKKGEEAMLDLAYDFTVNGNSCVFNSLNNGSHPRELIRPEKI